MENENKIRLEELIVKEVDNSLNMTREEHFLFALILRLLVCYFKL